MISIAELPLEQRRAFVAALLYVATVDEEYHSAEQDFVRSAFIAANLTTDDELAVIEVLRSRPPLERVLAPLKNQPVARLLVRELVALAHADGKYVDAERSGVALVSDLLGLPRAWLTDVESWVADGIAWQKRGIILIEN